ncbi:MAG: hypothetical protein IT384_19300 [Deltaproteobacteria bacterium]|nr:hypothetical protein [Deltaproteobacteria bacterium]
MTTFAGHNDFGTPTSVTNPTGQVTSYVFNGWNAPTQITETSALFDGAFPTPGTLSPVTSLSYNNLRQPDTMTLPKGNKQRWIWDSTAGQYGRLKAQASADSSGNLLEILRFAYDDHGNVKQERILDSISGSSPCADEECQQFDVLRERAFNVWRQLIAANLYVEQPSPPDPPPLAASMSYTYENDTDGTLREISSYLGTISAFEYDSLGRLSESAQDSTGLNAATGYSYDLWGRTATVTSAIGVTTSYEHDDFGQRVLERTRDRGDIRFEFDAKGAETKRQRSSFKSTANAETTCTTSDWLGRRLSINYSCDASVEWSLYYDGESAPSGACPTVGTLLPEMGRLSKIYASGFTRVICHHPNGQIWGSYQRDTATWNNSYATGFNQIFDLNGNLTNEFVHTFPATRAYAREIEYARDSTMKDRISYIRHKRTADSTWTYVTDNATPPTYFAFGGMKSIRYANGIQETNTRDLADRLLRRRTADVSPGTTIYTDVNLALDAEGNVSTYDDSLGLRHQSYRAAVDKLNRLRCLSRATISACSGSEPWEDKYLESLDYDLAGNRTNRRYGKFANPSGNGADEDAYSLVSGPTDIIDKTTEGGSVKEQYNDFKGDISQTNSARHFGYNWNYEGQMSMSNDSYLGNVAHWYTPFGERYRKQSLCNGRRTFYYYTPMGEAGTSHELKLLDLFNTCAAEYPRQYHTFIYLEGRPIAVARSQIVSGQVQTELATYWVHTDHLGTPVLVTQSNKTERWRWENDPFGRTDPIEYTVVPQDVNPDDDSSTGAPPKYNTCCCWACGNPCGWQRTPPCGAGTSSCCSGCCLGGGSQAVVWTRFYQVSGANNLRLHFSQFDVAAGSTRTGKDYVRLLRGVNGPTLIDLTGNLGDFWGPWAGVGTSSITLNLIADNIQDNTRGIVVDKLEYTTATNGQFVMHLRMPGQLWDEDVQASYNFQRWYRREDGRYLTPDPIGLAGGEPGYFAYAAGNPLLVSDASGLSSGSICSANPTLCQIPGRSGPQVISPPPLGFGRAPVAVVSLTPAPRRQPVGQPPSLQECSVREVDILPEFQAFCDPSRSEEEQTRAAAFWAGYCATRTIGVAASLVRAGLVDVYGWCVDRDTIKCAYCPCPGAMFGPAGILVSCPAPS